MTTKTITLSIPELWRGGLHCKGSTIGKPKLRKPLPPEYTAGRKYDICSGRGTKAICANCGFEEKSHLIPRFIDEKALPDAPPKFKETRREVAVNARCEIQDVRNQKIAHDNYDYIVDEKGRIATGAPDGNVIVDRKIEVKREYWKF